MQKKWVTALLAVLISFIGILTAHSESIVDSNLNISIPCVQVGTTYFECDLLKYNNSADPNGYYWQLVNNVIQTIDDGECASVDGNLLITLPTVDVLGTQYSATLNYYTNTQDPYGNYWTLASATPNVSTTFSLSSQDFSNGGMIPLINACANEGGSNISPQLSWVNPPQDTISFTLIMDDEDSPCGTGDNACRHWAVFNIPSFVTSFQTNQDISLISGVTEGENWEGSIGYAGPCPPNQHTYTITIYALASGMPTIDSGEQMTRSQFESAYASYIISFASIQGVFVP